MRHALRRAGIVTATLLAGAAVTVAVTVAVTGQAFAVAHGTPVPDGRYRFAVKLTMTNIPRPDGTHYNSACSAALVAPRWILTAGHCFHDVNRVPVSGPVPYPTTATVGRTDLSDHDGHVLNVVEVRQATGTDIALARLDHAVYDVAPLRLSTSTPTAGEVLRITGWGATDSVNPVPVTHLQTGQMTVSSVASTTLGVRGFKPSPDTSACLYDSGAPYFRERPHHAPLLVSVENFGPDCPHDQEETTARVDTIADWVQGTVH